MTATASPRSERAFFQRALNVWPTCANAVSCWTMQLAAVALSAVRRWSTISSRMIAFQCAPYSGFQ
jgi:hypothetical protein